MLSFLIIFLSFKTEGQIKDSKWFEKKIEWDYISYKASMQTFDEKNDRWSTDNEYNQETPILITNNYITVYGQTIMKYKILDIPVISTYPKEDDKEFSYSWLKVRDIKRDLICSVFLVKNRSQGGSLGFAYNKGGTGKYLLSELYLLK